MKGWGRKIGFIALGIGLTGVIGMMGIRLAYCLQNLNHYRLQIPFASMVELEPPLERDRYLKQFAAAADNDERWNLTEDYLYQYPISPFALSNKAYLLIEEGDSQGGIRINQYLLELYGEQSSTYNNIGRAYNQLTQYELAMHYIDKAVACNGGQATYKELLNYGNACQGLEQYEAAVEWYQQAMKEFPDDVKKYAPACHQELAATYKQMGDADACLAVNLEILELLPDNYSAFYDASSIYRDKGEAKKLMELGKTYTANNPEERYPFSLVGSMLLELEAYEWSADFYINYAEKSDFPSYGYYQAAKAYVLAENRELAKQYLERCLEYDSDYMTYMAEEELWGWLDDY